MCMYCIPLYIFMCTCAWVKILRWYGSHLPVVSEHFILRLQEFSQLCSIKFMPKFFNSNYKCLVNSSQSACVKMFTKCHLMKILKGVGIENLQHNVIILHVLTMQITVGVSEEAKCSASWTEQEGSASNQFKWRAPEFAWKFQVWQWWATDGNY